MQTDEDQIRAFLSTWIAATKAGDVAKVLSMVAEDVVFLQADKEPMRKSEFAAGLKAQSQHNLQLDASSEIQEIQVIGEWAFMWTKLKVAMTPPGTSTRQERAGHTLTILKKEAGSWVLARDANLLSSVKSEK